MGDERPIRVSQKISVGEMVGDVLNNKVNEARTRDYHSSLHSLYGKHEKHIQNERDVLHEVIKANLQMASEIASLKESVALLQRKVA